MSELYEERCIEDGELILQERKVEGGDKLSAVTRIHERGLVSSATVHSHPFV
jgi:hypothetical protein